jgi:hypothetical protein
MAPVAEIPPHLQSGVSLRWIKTRAIYRRVCFCRTNHLEFALEPGNDGAPARRRAAHQHIEPGKEKRMQDNNLIPYTEPAGVAAGSAGPVRAGRITGARLRRCPAIADAVRAP